MTLKENFTAVPSQDTSAAASPTPPDGSGESPLGAKLKWKRAVSPTWCPGQPLERHPGAG